MNTETLTPEQEARINDLAALDAFFAISRTLPMDKCVELNNAALLVSKMAFTHGMEAAKSIYNR